MYQNGEPWTKKEHPHLAIYFLFPDLFFLKVEPQKLASHVPAYIIRIPRMWSSNCPSPRLDHRTMHQGIQPGSRLLDSA